MRALISTIVALILLTTSGGGAATQGPDGPTTTDGPLPGVITEEVEPGVVRIVNDGLRDLSRSLEAVPPEGQYPMSIGGSGMTTGLDGSGWLHSGDDRLLKVGDATALELPRGVRSSNVFAINRFQVDRQGTPWVAFTELVRPRGKRMFRSVLYTMATTGDVSSDARAPGTAASSSGSVPMAPPGH